MTIDKPSLCGIYNVREHGAAGDGETDDTKAIQALIDACAASGGGTIALPRGQYSTGSLVLRSHITLRIDSGAELVGRPVPSLYPDFAPIVPSRMDMTPWKAFLYAVDAKHIRVTGPGRFNPEGGAEVFQDGKGNSPQRPYGIHFVRCRHVTVDNLDMRNSAFWMQRYYCCDGVRLTGLHVYNHCNLNNDGIDIDGCKRVIVSDCSIDSSDDALCIKSEGMSTAEDIVVTNCVISTHASGIKLGTGSCGGFKRITIGNCVIKPSRAEHIMHPFKLAGGIAGIDLGNVDGGCMEDINVHDIVIDGVLTPISVRLGKRNSRPWDGAPAIGETTARRIDISNVRAYNAGPIASWIAGVPDAVVEDIRLRNIAIYASRPGTEPYWRPGDETMEFDASIVEEATLLSLDVPEQEGGYPVARMFHRNLPAYGLYVRHVHGCVLSDIVLRAAKGEVRPAIVLNDVQCSRLREIDADGPKGVVWGRATVDIAADMEVTRKGE
jgi:hypothetical protein